MARLGQDNANLAAMIGFVRDQISHEGDGVGLKALDFAIY